MPDVLPDSRLTHRTTLGSVMADWAMPDGTTVRVECVPCFCANCGKSNGFVPKENTHFAFWLCQPCFDAYGDLPPGMYVQPDDAFWADVRAEMERTYGHVLSGDELAGMTEADLSPALQKLLTESPITHHRWRN